MLLISLGINWLALNFQWFLGFKKIQKATYLTTGENIFLASHSFSLQASFPSQFRLESDFRISHRNWTPHPTMPHEICHGASMATDFQIQTWVPVTKISGVTSFNPWKSFWMFPVADFEPRKFQVLLKFCNMLYCPTPCLKNSRKKPSLKGTTTCLKISKPLKGCLNEIQFAKGKQTSRKSGQWSWGENHGNEWIMNVDEVQEFVHEPLAMDNSKPRVRCKRTSRCYEFKTFKSWSSSMTIWQFHKTSCRWLSSAHYGRFTKKTISLSVLYPAKVNFIGRSLLAIQIQQFLDSLRNCHVRLGASEIHILCTFCLLEERRLAISYGFGKNEHPYLWRVTLIIYTVVIYIWTGYPP